MGYPQLSPLSQKLQYNKQDRTVPRCSLAQAEPRSQYIQLDYMVYFCSVRLKQKFFFYTISPLDSQKGNPCRSISLYLVPQSCRFWKLVVLRHDFCIFGPTLQFPKQYDEAIPLYARISSNHEHSYYNYSIFRE